MDPINYSGQLQQLDLSPLLQRLQLADQRQDRRVMRQQGQAQVQLAREKFDVEQQRDAAYVAAVKSWKDTGGSPEGLRDLALQFPEQSERLLKAGDSYESGAKRLLIGDLASVMGALSVKNPTLALSILDKRNGGLVNGGIDNSHTLEVTRMIKAGDLDGARSYLAYALSGLVEPSQAASVMEALGIGAQAEGRARDDARADRAQGETERHNRVVERQGQARVGISAAASARADRKASTAGKRGKSSGGFSDAQLDAMLR